MSARHEAHHLIGELLTIAARDIRADIKATYAPGAWKNDHDRDLLEAELRVIERLIEAHARFGK